MWSVTAFLLNPRKLKNGDIVNIDVTVIKEEYHGDTSIMVQVGDVAPHAQRLIQVTQECLYKALDIVRPGTTLGDIGAVIQAHAEKNYYSVVREYCGHGIGKVFHEDPQVLHYGKKGTGLVLEEGMTFTIEPMINAGKRQTKLNQKDGWTVTTRDGRLICTVGTHPGCHCRRMRDFHPSLERKLSGQLVNSTPTTLPQDLFDTAAFTAGLSSGNALDACKTAIAETTAVLHQRFRDGAETGMLLRQRASFIDALLGSLWDQQGWQSENLALVAVGGYGRGELHPHSDVDILILLGEDCTGAESQLEKFLTLLWDIGLDIGHSVRTVTECVEKAAAEITVLTNLMEARVLRGQSS